MNRMKNVNQRWFVGNLNRIQLKNMALTDRHHENEKFSTFLKIFQTTKKGSGAFTHESAIIIGFHCIVSAPVAVTAFSFSSLIG